MKRQHPALTEANGEKTPPEPMIHAPTFRRRLMAWYRLNARALPWRGITDPYRTWVSEVMLQQTRVAFVLPRYDAFIRRFPTLLALALASEDEVLAAWSGLGYYRRARMLHRAAQFVVTECEGQLPLTAIELRTLPGIGEYTAAAIASICFGQSVPVVDGNVARVLLRLTGRPDDATAANNAFIHGQALSLVPAKRLLYSQPGQQDTSDTSAPRISTSKSDAVQSKTTNEFQQWLSQFPGQATPPAANIRSNAAGDHNQAMMELGATICLPKSPLCLSCPVYSFCLTRGEHRAPTRAALRSQPVAYLLNLRKRGPVSEVLLVRRSNDVSLMPGMYELPWISLEAVEGREPILRVRHAITNTNYYVQVFNPSAAESAVPAKSLTNTLLRAHPPSTRHWVRASQLPTAPLTGLARKVLQRLNIMEMPHLNILD